MRGKSALKVALLRACVESMESWPLGPNNKNRQKVTKNTTKSKQRKSLQRLHFPTTARSSNPNTGTWTSAKSETDGTASEEDEEDLTVFFFCQLQQLVPVTSTSRAKRRPLCAPKALDNSVQKAPPVAEQLHIRVQPVYPGRFADEIAWRRLKLLATWTAPLGVQQKRCSGRRRHANHEQRSWSLKRLFRKT